MTKPRVINYFARNVAKDAPPHDAAEKLEVSDQSPDDQEAKETVSTLRAAMNHSKK